MKKTLAIILLSLALVFTGCGDSTDTSDQTKNDQTKIETSDQSTDGDDSTSQESQEETGDQANGHDQNEDSGNNQDEASNENSDQGENDGQVNIQGGEDTLYSGFHIGNNLVLATTPPSEDYELMYLNLGEDAQLMPGQIYNYTFDQVAESYPPQVQPDQLTPMGDGAGMKISLDDAEEIMNYVDNAYVIDVRSKSEYESGHVDGAINIPSNQLEKVEDLVESKDDLIIVYCQTGKRSAQAAKDLQMQGYRNVLDAGAYE